ncbi:hypothetical protein ACQKWADRAFT_326354 [Trichoderma austrokoningii]
MGDPEKEITAEDVPIPLQPNGSANDVDKSFPVIAGQKRRSGIFCSASGDGACSFHESLERATSAARKRKKTDQDPTTRLPDESKIAEKREEFFQPISIFDHKDDPSLSPSGEIESEWLLSKLEKLQGRLEEALQKLIDEMDGDQSLPEVSQPDLHATNKQRFSRKLINSQYAKSIPVLSLGSPISPLHSAITTPQVSSTKLVQSIEIKETTSERLLPPIFLRVDRHWDASEQKFIKPEPTIELGYHEIAQAKICIFVVRRDFDCNNTHVKTTVEIKDSLFRECLQHIIGSSSGVNFAEENPVLDPKTLFVYWDDFKSHRKSLAQAELDNITDHWPKKKRNEISFKKMCLGTLIGYLEQEFSEDKKNLDSMLSKGVITFDLLWALWKPSTLIFSPTYRDHDVPSVSMLRYAENRKNQSPTDSKYSINSVYIDSDGKTFAYKPLKREVQHFNGAVDITSLPSYPLQYHKCEAQIRHSLVERGAKFVSLQGIHHKSFTGLTFPLVQSKRETLTESREERSRIMVDAAGFRDLYPEVFKTRDMPIRYTNIDETSQNLIGTLSTETAEDDQEINDDSLSRTLEMSKNNLLLLCSPVVVGYSLASLEWLEFDVRGIEDVKWNEEEWDSLVLDEQMKELIKATVTSRIKSKLPTKAKGLTKKYDCLGEERKNLIATVSRRLESFQGIIFMTCNTIRIKVFEEAYQSRIDFVQKYDNPDTKSKSIILKRAIRRVKALGLWRTEAFSDEDYRKLVERNLSGREIEKTVELALNLAEARQEALGVRHLQDVMDLQERFRCDFGGRGYGNYFS